MSSDTSVGLAIVLFGLLASGIAVLSGIISPGVRWYDRTIRIFGGGIIFLVLLLVSITLFVKF